MVAQVDEQHAAMVADAMAPAGQPNRLADMALAERAAGMGPVTMHGGPENGCRRDRNRQAERPARSAAGFTRARSGAATECARHCFGLEKARRSRAYLGLMTVHFPFQNTYAALPANFFARVAPTPVAAPRLIKLNRPLGACSSASIRTCSTPPRAPKSWPARPLPDGAEPIAMAYAGHQFGHFVPQLGDGRAILLGEVIDKDGVRRDIQLKGSGPTPFSRRGDGRAALGPVLREYIVSEAMAALGIPTTRSLAAVITGERVDARDRAARRGADARRRQPYPRRHLPVFRGAQRHRGGAAARRPRHRPALPRSRRGRAALSRAARGRDRRARPSWSRAGCMVGFIHGVMNTDNTSISGETIDYGPCAFMDALRPRHRVSARSTRWAATPMPTSRASRCGT